MAAVGVSCLLRRTYKSPFEPAPTGAYDFVNYFECTLNLVDAKRFV